MLRRVVTGRADGRTGMFNSCSRAAPVASANRIVTSALPGISPVNGKVRSALPPVAKVRVCCTSPSPTVAAVLLETVSV
ncbi:hypothetical protein D3C80_2045580 [compost metagenome]